MKQVYNIFSISFLILLGCQSNSINESGKYSNIDSTHIFTQDTTNVYDSIHDECIRGLPEPFLNKSMFRSTSFRLINREGFETGLLENGDRLDVKNYGCEYYILSFSFQTTRFRTDSLNFILCCDQILDLLYEVKNKATSAVAINDMINTFEKLKMGKSANNFQDEFIIYEGDISTQLKVNRIRQISGYTANYIFDYSIGPL